MSPLTVYLSVISIILKRTAHKIYLILLLHIIVVLMFFAYDKQKYVLSIKLKKWFLSAHFVLK